MGDAWHQLYARRASMALPEPKPLVDIAALFPTGMGWQALGPAVAVTTVAFVIVCLRLYTRGVLLRYVRQEDGLITLSMVRWALDSDPGVQCWHPFLWCILLTIS
jgi:hypothetical protein